jgi:muramidase (phage lysozyme)
MKNVEIKWVEKSTAGGRYDMVISYTDSETLMVVVHYEPFRQAF